MKDDEEDEDDDYEDEDDLVPFSEGIDSVSWLPTVIGANGSSKDLASETLTQPDAEIIPLFPLGGIVYTPNSEHILNIFEPRYRQMYSDILMNGTKRFAVAMSHPTQPGRFAEMAVLFELQDLKEVSEQTADQIKYICNHKVTGRVKLHRILNPEAWETRSTYLRAEGTVMDDSNKENKSIVSESNPSEERALRKVFTDLVELQHELEEDVRFTRASALTLAVSPGSGDNGLWQTIKLWQSFADQRLMARQNELQRDFQEKLQEYLRKEKGMDGKELPR
jgi:Lon protease-like protein